MKHESPLILDAPVTALRCSFERARSLPLEQQIQECVDQLQHPELLVAELLDAYRVMATCFEDAADPDCDDEEKEPSAGPRATTLVEDFIWESRELTVVGQPCSFTCLDTNVNPINSLDPLNGDGKRLSTGLDYVGLACDDTGSIVLGAVQAPGDATAYPLLLRLLACLTEVAPPAQLERMNRLHFKGLAGPKTRFDLNLVLWERSDEPEMTPISQLTRDLAENLKAGARACEQFPDLLRDIVCLRMNPDRFDGRLRFDWRV